MNLISVLVVFFVFFIAPPAMAQGICVPTELRDSIDVIEASGLEELRGANAKLDKAKATASQVVGTEQEKDRAKRTVQSAADKVVEAEVLVRTQAVMTEAVRKFALCSPPQGLATDRGFAARVTNLAKIDTVNSAGALGEARYADQLTVLSNSFKQAESLLKILIALIFFMLMGMAVVCFFLYANVKRTKEDSTAQGNRIQRSWIEASNKQTEEIRKLFSPRPPPAIAKPQAHPTSPQANRDGHKTQSGSIPSGSMSSASSKARVEQNAAAPVAGGFAVIPSERSQQEAPAYRAHGLKQSPQDTLISNGNVPSNGTTQRPPQGEPLHFEEDFDLQLTEVELWPILLPMAANQIETIANLDAASLTRELLAEISRSRPGLAQKLSSIGFQSISGRLAPDGREASRNPEMFAVEVSGRTLLFPSPRSKYKQGFDTFFQGASTENWRECIKPALVQITGDNLLTVIERGISGRS